jgi:hypothetical protein
MSEKMTIRKAELEARRVEREAEKARLREEREAKLEARRAEREAEKVRLEKEREAQWVLDMAAWEADREARRVDREAVKKAIKEAERAAREARKEEERARKEEARQAEREALPPPVHKELPKMTDDKYLATLNYNLRNDLRFAVGRHVRGYPAVVIEYWALRFALEHVDEFRSRLEARRW